MDAPGPRGEVGEAGNAGGGSGAGTGAVMGRGRRGEAVPHLVSLSGLFHRVEIPQH